MKHEINEDLLPKLKEGKKVKKESKDLLKEETIQKSKTQSLISLIVIIIGYILLSISILVKNNIDSLIGWLAFLMLGGIPIVISSILLFIGFILNILAYSNDKKNKIVSINLCLLVLPIVISIIKIIIDKFI